MMNYIAVQGRLVRDIEVKNTGNGTAVASFSIACERDFKRQDSDEREADFIDIVAWRNTAEFAQKYFHQGDMMIITGRLQVRPYEDKDGNKRRSTEVLADHIYFGGSKRDGGNGNQQNGGFQSSGSENPFVGNDGFMSIPDGVDDEGLPFN